VDLEFPLKNFKRNVFFHQSGINTHSELTNIILMTFLRAILPKFLKKIFQIMIFYVEAFLAKLSVSQGSRQGLMMQEEHFSLILQE
jgi:hypothetical protein